MKIKRGDTKRYKFPRKVDGKIVKERAEHVYFTVKENKSDNAKAVLQKTIDDMQFDEDGYYHITLLPDDTNDLQIKTYPYDIEVKIGDDYVQTINKEEEFKVVRDYTRPEDEV